MMNNPLQVELSAHERMLCRLLARGLSDSEIASELGNNEREVEQSVSALARRSAAEDRLELTLFALVVTGEPTEKKPPRSDDGGGTPNSATDTTSQGA